MAERGSIPRKMPAYDKRTATFLPLRAALLSPAFVNKGNVNEKERERESNWRGSFYIYIFGEYIFSSCKVIPVTYKK